MLSVLMMAFLVLLIVEKIQKIRGPTLKMFEQQDRMADTLEKTAKRLRLSTEKGRRFVQDAHEGVEAIEEAEEDQPPLGGPAAGSLNSLQPLGDMSRPPPGVAAAGSEGYPPRCDFQQIVCLLESQELL